MASTNENTALIPMEEQIAKLESKLLEATAAVAEATERSETDKKRLKNATAAYKSRLQSNSIVIKRYCSERDRELSKITSRLLYFEARLMKEQQEIVAALRDREEMIEEQENVIAELTIKNSELHQALSAAEAKLGKNGYVSKNDDNNLKENFDVSSKESKSKHEQNLTVEIHYPAQVSTRYVSKLAAMKNRLRKHKSNSDLNQGDKTIVEETAEDVSLSQENLSSMMKLDKLHSRGRCKSIAGYPLAELASLINGSPGVSDGSSPVYSNSLTVNGDMYLSDRRASSHSVLLPDSPTMTTKLHQEYTWKTGKRSIKDKAKNAFSSYLSVSSSDITETKTYDTHKEQRKSVSAMSTPVNQGHETISSSDSNPFKSIKSMIKLKGSKFKTKKRSSSLPQSTQAEFHEALKRNNEKYKLQVK